MGWNLNDSTTSLLPNISFLSWAKWLHSTKMWRTVRLHWQCSHTGGGSFFRIRLKQVALLILFVLILITIRFSSRRRRRRSTFGRLPVYGGGGGPQGQARVAVLTAHAVRPAPQTAVQRRRVLHGRQRVLRLPPRPNVRGALTDQLVDVMLNNFFTLDQCKIKTKLIMIIMMMIIIIVWYTHNNLITVKLASDT